MTCTTHHDACECREAAHKTEIEAKDKRIAELEAEAEHRAAQEEEDNLIACIWKESRRIEHDSIPYIKKAISTFESVAKDWESDSRQRVSAAIADARKEMKGKLDAAEVKAQADAEAAAELANAKAQPGGEQLSPAAQALNESEGEKRFAAAHKTIAKVTPIKKMRPSDDEVVEAIQRVFDVQYDEACTMILSAAEYLRSAA